LLGWDLLLIHYLQESPNCIFRDAKLFDNSVVCPIRASVLWLTDPTSLLSCSGFTPNGEVSIEEDLASVAGVGSSKVDVGGEDDSTFNVDRENFSRDVVSWLFSCLSFSTVSSACIRADVSLIRADLSWKATRSPE
jgi:hypothetical protein